MRTKIKPKEDGNEENHGKESLKELSIRYKAILEAVPDIIMEVDANKIYTWANKAGLDFFGDDVVGKSADFYFAGEQETYNIVQPIFKGSEDIIYVESWQRRNDGEKRLLGWWCKVMKDINGDAIGALSTAQDITERKKSEKQLKHLTTVLKAIRNVNQLITHERNPAILIREACDKLVEERRYNYARIVILDKKNNIKDYADSVIDSSLNAKFEKNKFDELPYCMRVALDNSDIQITDRTQENCLLCSIRYENENCYNISLRLEFEGKVYGILSVSIPSEIQFDGEERSLFNELAGDISFALATIETEEEKQKAEEETHRIAKEWQSTFDAQQDAIWIIDNNGKILRANKVSELFFNRPLNEIIGKQCFEIVHGTAKPIDGCPIELMRKSLRHEKMELQIGERIFEVNVDPILDNAGQLNGTVHIIADITERKQSENALIDSEERFRMLFENAPLGYQSLNVNGDFIELNETWCQLLGYTKEEVLGRNFSEFIHPDFRKVFKENFPKFKSLGYILGVEFEMIKKDGSELIVTFEGKIGKNNDGSFKQTHCVLQDITERKQAEEELETQKVYLENLFESSPEAVVILDKDDRILKINPEFTEIFGYTVGEAVGNQINDLIVPEELKEEGQSATNNVALGKSIELETIRQHKNGKKLNVSILGKPIIQKNKQLAVYGIYRDITERKQAEEALRESEEVHSKMVANIGDVIVIIDDEGLNQYKSPNIEKLFGWKPEELVGKSTWDNVHPDDLEHGKSFIGSLLEEPNKTGTTELRYKRKDGSYSYIQFTGVNLFHDPDIKGILGNYRDITERKQSEESLVASEVRYRRLFESAKDGILILDAETAMIVDVNPFLTDLLGFTAEEILMKTIWDIGFLKDILDNKDKFLELQQQKYVRYEDLPLETKDGRKINIEFISNVYEVNGKEVIQCNIRDISDRKQAEESLRESEERYSSIVNSSPNVILIHKDGIIQFINNLGEKVLGYTENESIGKNVLDFLTKNSREKVIENMENRKKGEEIPAYEADIITKSGKILSMLIQVTMIPHQKENLFLVMLTDISEIKKYQFELKIAKERAEEMNKVKSHFFSNMSHEMRTPMVGILGFANLLMKEVYKEDQKEMAEMIVTSGNRLMDTLNLILDLSSVEAGRQVVMRNEVSIPYVVYDSLELFSPTARQKNLYLKTSIIDDEVTANLDESLLIKVINNLVNNAIKFTDKGGITVAVDSIVKDEVKSAVIKVIDTGIGISDESKEVIFKEFRQGSEGKDRSFDGTGLGLTISKKYVELMDGTISVDSQIGVGSTFTITFPALNCCEKKSDTATESEKSQIEKPAEVQETKLPKILIVEDDLATLILTKRYLQEICEVDSVSSGDKAIELVNNNTYPLIVMDINLGKGMSGLDITKEIRQMDKYKDTPIIAMTAFAMKGDREEFLNGGCSHYMSKPYDRDEFIELIVGLLKNK